MISILITNYNENILKLLDSCLNNRINFEIIFYDDNSTDNSFKLT